MRETSGLQIWKVVKEVKNVENKNFDWKLQG